jgi:hypothetical protein
MKLVIKSRDIDLYRLVIRRKEKGSGFHQVGVAWERDDKPGSFTIRLHPCVVLTDRDDIYINLFPNKFPDRAKVDEPQVESKPSTQPWDPNDGDDIPF